MMRRHSIIHSPRWTHLKSAPTAFLAEKMSCCDEEDLSANLQFPLYTDGSLLLTGGQLQSTERR